ncbi:MAG TPA: ABC transporter substrate-binding protein [Bryobacteraceae bacterium]|nr:ABC transporter substrate-binding protein [Bryobacteraceae bacterium]
MKRIVWAWLALSSLALGSLALAQADAAVRPHYGGTLTVELSSPWATPDPASSALSIPVTETLVRLNAHGAIEPLLGVFWQHDADFKRWRFSLRPKVSFHDGEPLTGPSAAPSLLAALKKKYADVSIEAGGQAIVIQSHEPMPDLLTDLAAPGAAVFRTSESDPLIGTGPFRVTGWEPGRRLVLSAFDDCWSARPYLDSVAIEFGFGHAHADIFDIPAGPARRFLPEGIATWTSVPRTLVAITASNAQPALLEALALVIDRTPIVNVLAQRKGDAAFGLLPQWLTGYAFLFHSPLDAVRARQIASRLRIGSMGLSYPGNDPFLRSVADRVALNARDAGITIQPTQNPAANLRLVEWPLESTSAATELERIAATLGAGRVDARRPETSYEAERSLLDRVIPIVHLRETYGIAPRVHIESAKSDTFALHLEDAWVQP